MKNRSINSLDDFIDDLQRQAGRAQVAISRLNEKRLRDYVELSPNVELKKRSMKVSIPPLMENSDASPKIVEIPLASLVQLTEHEITQVNFSIDVELRKKKEGRVSNWFSFLLKHKNVKKRI